MKISLIKVSSVRMGRYIKLRDRFCGGVPIFKTNRKQPKRLTTALINVQNEDDYCAIYCIVLHLFKNELASKKLSLTDPENLKKYFKYINTKGVEFPLDEENLKKLEQKNKHLNLALNVFHFQTRERIDPFFLSSNNSENRTVVNMLLLTNGNNTHLVYIRNFNALLRKQSTRKKHYCPRCFTFSTGSLPLLSKHVQICGSPKQIKRIYPDSKTNQLKVPSPFKLADPVLRMIIDFESKFFFYFFMND